MHSDSICIVGPTACHKTETAVAIAQRFGGEVVSADSVQVYRGMDIGSAKPTQEEMRRIPHHAMDCVDIDTPDFSVAQYREIARGAINRIRTAGHLPIIVGGSGLYVHALTHALSFATLPADASIRDELEKKYDANPDRLFASLLSVDNSNDNRIHYSDKKRIVRALEIYQLTGRIPSTCTDAFRSGEAGEKAVCSPVMIGLTMDRATLYARIDQRVDQMMANGLLDEVERIYRKAYDRRLPAMQSIGYRQLFAYFDGFCTLQEAVARIKLDTRHFAKRQWTWFKREEGITWFDVTVFDGTTIDKIENEIRKGMVEAS